MSKTFCPLPWIHLGTHPQGGVTPCCVSDHSHGQNRARNFTDIGEQFLTLNDSTITEHMNSDYFKKLRLQFLNGEIPRACRRCFEEEENGIHSKRITESFNFPDATFEKASSVTEEDGAIPIDLKFVELRLGNVCNLKCITCNPASSSRWMPDYKKVVEKINIVDKTYLNIDQDKDFNWAEDEQFYEDLYNSAPNMEVLYINGGEPTLIESHWNYVRKLVESGRSKDIIIWYNINMTTLPDFAIDLWKEFKEARIHPSIDCLEERNSYIRFPSKWDTITKNLEKLLEADLNVRITQTVSAYNYFYIPEFFRWAPCNADVNHVYDPSYLSPAVLPPYVRDIVHGKIKNSFDIPGDYCVLEDTFASVPWDENGWKQFCMYNDEMDKIRNTDWRKTFRKLINILEINNTQHRFNPDE